jgi:hypothetical protein
MSRRGKTNGVCVCVCVCQMGVKKSKLSAETSEGLQQMTRLKQES